MADAERRTQQRASLTIEHVGPLTFVGVERGWANARGDVRPALIPVQRSLCGGGGSTTTDDRNQPSEGDSVERPYRLAIACPGAVESFQSVTDSMAFDDDGAGRTGTGLLAAVLHRFGRGGHRSMTNMIVYLLGTLLVVAGLAYGASRAGVSSTWIIVGALVIVGFGLMAGIVKTRQKDPAS